MRSWSAGRDAARCRVSARQLEAGGWRLASQRPMLAPLGSRPIAPFFNTLLSA